MVQIREVVTAIKPTGASSSPFNFPKGDDSLLATLAAEFAQMAARVKQREDELKQQVIELKIEIDVDR